MVASAGAVLLKPDTAEAATRGRLTNLIRVGGRVAVLGVDPRRAGGWWHVANPGSWDAPTDNSGGLTPDGLVFATAMCKTRIVTNGYAADWRPPVGQLCPACAERV